MKRQELTARLIELLVTSSIAPTYQEAVISSLHNLDEAALRLLCSELERLHSSEQNYQIAVEQWVRSWAGISKRLSASLQAEAERIEREVDLELELLGPRGSVF